MILSHSNAFFNAQDGILDIKVQKLASGQLLGCVNQIALWDEQE